MSDIRLGLNARLFPNNWRPLLAEIAFAKDAGFRAIQLAGQEAGLNEAYLAASFNDIAKALNDADIMPVMEILIRVSLQGYTASGNRPLEILEANLPAIKALGCDYVHWHLAPDQDLRKQLNRLEDRHIIQLEQSLRPQFSNALALAETHGFKFSFEHNEGFLKLFASAKSCEQMLKAVQGLGLVWDINHVTLAELPSFQALIPYVRMLHVSDTPHPEVNYHLPLNRGNIDFKAIFSALSHAGFSGPAILEIGGLPKSGGYGQDTDEALMDSKTRLETLLTELSV